MQMRIKRGFRGISGFFLMETIVLVIIFMSFSMVMIGWYSHFILRKADIIKRGKALSIASNILEMMRMERKMPNFLDKDSGDGFKVAISVERSSRYRPSDLYNFAEVTVCVKFNEYLDPVCLSTGMMLPKSSFFSFQGYKNE